MAHISFDEDEVIEYVFEGERASENPCSVLLRFVSYKKVQRYRKMIITDFAEKSDGVKNARRLSEIRIGVERDVQRKQFLENVVEVRNYFIKGEEVKDPGRFYDTAPADLVLETIRAMEDAQQLSEGQRKNSSGQSAGA